MASVQWDQNDATTEPPTISFAAIRNGLLFALPLWAAICLLVWMLWRVIASMLGWMPFFGIVGLALIVKPYV